MSQRNGLLWLLAAGTFAAVSCSTPRTHYYTMEFPHTPPAAASVVACQIAVQPFRTDQAFADDRIAFHENQNEVNHYEYQRWAGRPADLVTNYFLHRLKDSGVYAGVSAYKEGPAADFVLTGWIHRFEEVDRGKEVSASVDLELELLNGKSRASLWRSEAECTKPLASRDVAGVTQVIHACLEETAGKLLGEVHSQIEKSAAH
jgi:ABC-type uncharacterized transport system auxiliary subunit